MIRPVTLVLTAAACICAACARNGSQTESPNELRARATVHAAGSDAAVEDARRLLHLLDSNAIRALRDARGPAGVAWQSDPAAESRRVEELLATEHAARAVLVDTFGDAVRQSPAFWYLFTPLIDRMPELDSDRQIAIHDLERRFVASAAGDVARPSFADHLAGVRATAGDAIALEYALRTSPLAAELRNSGIDLSEQEFRYAYEALSTQSVAGDGMAIVEARRGLRTRLGDRRFARLWALRDPRFARLRTVAARFDLHEEKLIAGYAVLMDTQDSMLATALRSDNAEAASQQQLRTLHESGRRKLTEIVGSSAADAMMRAFASAAELPRGG